MGRFEQAAGAQSFAPSRNPAQKLAERARLSLNTIKAIENGSTDPKASTLRKIEQVLTAAGIELIEGGHSGGPGVRLRKS